MVVVVAKVVVVVVVAGAVVGAYSCTLGTLLAAILPGSHDTGHVTAQIGGQILRES